MNDSNKNQIGTMKISLVHQRNFQKEYENLLQKLARCKSPEEAEAIQQQMLTLMQMVAETLM